MAGSLNKVILVGNLGADPDVRAMQNGDKVANLRIATSQRWRDRDGQQQERTEWHSVVIFGRIAEVAEQYLRKGSQILIEGQLRTRKWTNQQGQDQYSTEVVVSGFSGNMTMLGGRSDSTGGGMSSSRQNNNDSSRQSNNDYRPNPSQGTPSQGSNTSDNDGGGPDYSAELDDEIPF